MSFLTNKSFPTQVLRDLKASESGFPSAIVIGSATHTIKSSNNSAEALDAYKKNLTILRPVSKQASELLNKIYL